MRGAMMRQAHWVAHPSRLRLCQSGTESRWWSARTSAQVVAVHQMVRCRASTSVRMGAAFGAAPGLPVEALGRIAGQPLLEVAVVVDQLGHAAAACQAGRTAG